MTRNDVKKIGLWVLTSALILQTTHMVEHFTQLYQYLILQMPVFEAHGILFFLDLEQNHFYFNLAYLILLVVGGVKSGMFTYKNWANAGGYFLFSLGVLVQTYHVMEHTARIGQYIQTGCTPCKGVLGWYFNGIYLHFTLNSTTLLLPATALWLYLSYRKQNYHQE